MTKAKNLSNLEKELFIKDVKDGWKLFGVLAFILIVLPALFMGILSLFAWISTVVDPNLLFLILFWCPVIAFILFNIIFNAIIPTIKAIIYSYELRKK